MVDYWLDYSADRLTGTVIKNAGYKGVIRYVGGTSIKHTNVTEYNSIKAAGLGFLAVKEVNTSDANGGYARGVSYAQSAKNHCDQLGYHGVIFFCNDAPTLSSATLWDDYLTGAASVLGWDRVGAYGFANAMDVARNMTPCQYFWMAGRYSGVAARPYLNFWQDNNVQVTVGGITCDRNMVLAPMGDEVSIYDYFTVTKPDGKTFQISYAAAIQNLYVMTFYGSGFDPWKGPGLAATLNEVKAAVLDVTDVDINEAAVAAEVARQLVPQLPSLLANLSDEDIAKVARAVADESDRRDRDGDPSTGNVS